MNARWFFAILGGGGIAVTLMLALVFMWRGAQDEGRVCCADNEKVIIRIDDDTSIAINYIPGDEPYMAVNLDGLLEVAEPDLPESPPQIDAEPPEAPAPDAPTLSGNVTGAGFCGRIIYRPLPRFPAYLNQDTGSVTVLFDVKADGSVESIRIVSTTSQKWARAVREAIAQWHYEPFNAAAPRDACRPPFRDLKVTIEFKIAEAN